MERDPAGPPETIDSLYFPRAAQSDILRAAQKDEICLRALESSIRDVVHGYLGSASLHKYGDAVRALATTAYYATSIGAGQRTLGEEYCDLLQVSPSRMEPSQTSRALQVLLHTAIPLLRAKLTSLEDAASPPESPTTTAATNLAYGSAGEVHHALLASALPSSPCLSSAFDSASDLAEVLMSSHVMPVPADTLALPPDSRHSGQSHHATTPMLSPAPSSPLPRSGNGNGHSQGNGNGHSLGNGNGYSHAPESDAMYPPTSLSHGPAADRSSHNTYASPSTVMREWMLSSVPACSVGLASSTYKSLSRVYRRVCRSAAAAGVSQWLPIASQLHLALFYIFGLYYEVPKRLGGVQFAHIGATPIQRRYFGAMGVLLLVQVLVNARSLRSNGQTQEQKGNQQRLKVHAVDDTHQQPTEAGSSHESSSGVACSVGLPLSSRTQGQCPLCLADRVVPTALPCGHLFCWKCAVEWCQRKPVCPLCRLGASLQDLIPLAHAVI